MSSTRRVLLTNDDGIDAPGLHALARAFVTAGFELLVVAPASNRSASGRAFSMGELTVGRTQMAGVGEVFTVDGTPVDCVRVAYLGVRPDFHADIVVSGINEGANLGEDIPYSGTVGGACEGAVFGAIGVAVSQQRPLEVPGASRIPDADRDAVMICRLLQSLGGFPELRGTFFNVNLPARPIVGVQVAGLAKIAHPDGIFAEPRPAKPQWWAYRDGPVFVEDPASDAACLERGLVTLTALRPAPAVHLNSEVTDVLSAAMSDGVVRP